MKLVKIENSGQEIVSTNYWQTDAAVAGNFYLSINAGAFRLLVPEAQEGIIAEIETARSVEVYCGDWTEAGKRGTWQLVFDDGSDTPFMLMLSPEQVDRTLPEADSGREDLVLLVYTQDGEVLRRPAKFRLKALLPYLGSWG